MEVDSIALGCAPRLDSSIETAFLLAALADRAGDKVHVLAVDSHVRARVSGVRGPKIIETLARTFTDISARLDVTDWSQVAATVEQTVHHSAFVVIATKIPPAGMETEFTDALSRAVAARTPRRSFWRPQQPSPSARTRPGRPTCASPAPSRSRPPPTCCPPARLIATSS